MNHPFELDVNELESLDFNLEEQVSDEELEKISGGINYTTLRVGEEGGKKNRRKQRKLTTFALGEEGGFRFPKWRKFFKKNQN